MRKQTAVWMLVSALVLTMVKTLEVRAQEATLAITDAGEPHAPIIRFDQFLTSLTASVQNPPQSTTEATITGPKWMWSGGKSPVQLTSIADSPSNGLDSGFPGNYGDTKNDALFKVPVSCTARYTKTDNKTGAQSPIDVSGSKLVTFFIRWPQVMKHISTVPNDEPTLGRSPYNGERGIWGVDDIHNLQIQDNQSPRQPYGNGAAHEDFIDVFPPGEEPNGPGGGSTWPVGANVPDHVGVGYRKNPNLPDDHLESRVSQLWSCIEDVPPQPSPFQETTSLGFHIVWKYFKYSMRTGG